MACLDLFKNTSFLFKFVAMVLVLLSTIFFSVNNKDRPTYNEPQTCLLFHAMGGYNIILVTFVILYFMDDIPGIWMQRIFVLVGAILLIVIGAICIICVFDDNRSSYATVQSICLLVAGILLAIDFIKENFC